MTNQFKISDFSDDILRLIFGNLAVIEQVTIQRVSKRFSICSLKNVKCIHGPFNSDEYLKIISLCPSLRTLEIKFSKFKRLRGKRSDFIKRIARLNPNLKFLNSNNEDNDVYEYLSQVKLDNLNYDGSKFKFILNYDTMENITKKFPDLQLKYGITIDDEEKNYINFKNGKLAFFEFSLFDEDKFTYALSKPGHIRMLVIHLSVIQNEDLNSLYRFLQNNVTKIVANFKSLERIDIKIFSYGEIVNKYFIPLVKNNLKSLFNIRTLKRIYVINNKGFIKFQNAQDLDLV